MFCNLPHAWLWKPPVATKQPVSHSFHSNPRLHTKDSDASHRRLPGGKLFKPGVLTGWQRQQDQPRGEETPLACTDAAPESTPPDCGEVVMVTSLICHNGKGIGIEVCRIWRSRSLIESTCKNWDCWRTEFFRQEDTSWLCRALRLMFHYCVQNIWTCSAWEWLAFALCVCTGLYICSLSMWQLQCHQRVEYTQVLTLATWQLRIPKIARNGVNVTLRFYINS